MFGKLLNLKKLIYLHSEKEIFVFLLEAWIIFIPEHRSLPLKSGLKSYSKDSF